MVGIRGIGLALIVLVATASPVLADAIGPHWGSDKLRAARNVQPVDAVRFRLHRLRIGAGGRKTASDSEVILAPDFTFVRTGGQSSLYDHALCRWLVWPAATGGLSSINCHALPYFFAVEMQNRLVQNKVLPEAARPMMIYEAETELHIAGNGPGGRPTLTRSSAKDGADYVVADRKVAHIAGDAGALKSDEAVRLIRFLALATPVHPEMRRDIAAAGRLPAEIAMDALGPGQGERETLSFSRLEHVKAAYPLPPGLRPEIDGPAWTKDAAMAGAVKAGVAVLRDPAAHPAPTADALAQRVAAADAAHRPAAALFAIDALVQLYGQAAIQAPARLAAIRSAFQALSKDSRAAAILDAGRLAGDVSAKGDRQAAARTMLEAGGDEDLVDFRDITLGNLMLGSSDLDRWDPALRARLPESAADGFWRSIAVAPWSAATYHDVGVALLGEQRVDFAWLAFDLGRATDPGWRTGIMASIAATESRLEHALPDMF